MNLYELTQEAISQFDTYKYPNLDEWIDKIDKILTVLKEPTISGDKIENIYFDEDSLKINTSYSVRCCECSNDMSISIEILQNENPVKKATKDYLRKELNSAQNEVTKLNKELEIAYAKLEKSTQLYNLEDLKT
jgi:DNA-binding NtrC family response regulator